MVASDSAKCIGSYSNWYSKISTYWHFKKAKVLVKLYFCQSKGKEFVMHSYDATVAWQRSGQTFTDNRYSRGHRWSFDGGADVPASSSPHVVPVPMSDAAGVDPEEALVAATSSCHMLFFLSFAARRDFIVDSYTDRASGIMEKNAEGRMAMTRITLRPDIVFVGEHRPTREELDRMHHDSHEQCFIANSLKSEIVVEPVT
jgi:organic hydroperoxide reductase OsmC/OhrA